MTYIDQAQLWLANATQDADLATELSALLQENDQAGLEDRFYQNLAFGTGGLRGKIGAGTNRMNVYTVGKATQGLAQYLTKTNAENKVAIAYDSRIKSQLFALHAAQVLAANGIKALLYGQLAPTPALSFAVRHHGCTAGICITASHNPAAYNGYKVYGADGCQITTEAANVILAEINSVDIFAGVKSTEKEQALANGDIEILPESTMTAFLDEVYALRLETQPCDTLSVVYTPLNGTGLVGVSTTLQRMGVAQLSIVPEQCLPDENFTTCQKPNPEEPEAMTLGLALCQKTNADLLLATDPDCDRVGVAAKEGDGYRLLSGNEIGVLLFDYICRKRTQNGTLPQNAVAVKTIVTTEMAAKVAQEYGVALVNVLTGFKFIGEQIGALEAQNQADRYIFGFEESCGYLSGTHVRDKDGVNAAMLICDMAQSYKRQGMTLTDALYALCQKHGHWLSGLDSFAFEGASGMETMAQLMQNLRKAPPHSLGGMPMQSTTDYLWQAGDSKANRSLPSSDVLQFQLACGVVTVRPSGTEPKIKLYFSVCGADAATANANLNALRSDLVQMMGL